ncbi:MAG: hypothetical protein Q9164_006663 [Protoblastenia rupestris]
MQPKAEPTEGHSYQSSTNTNSTQTPSPRSIINDGCITNSIPEVRRGLYLSTKSAAPNPPLLTWSLSCAIKHAQPTLVRYLLDEEHAPIASVTPSKLGATAARSAELGRVKEVFHVLVERGWDINQHEPSSSNNNSEGEESLLHLVAFSEELVNWCLEHGASVPSPPSSSSILESVASIGSVSTFRVLQERGAQLGRRTLHRAVESAAYASQEGREGRMAMVRFLADEVGCGVNDMDTGEKIPNFWGTPICYAVHAGEGGDEVVKFLLERGADPYVKDCWGSFDAFRLAEMVRNERVLRVLREWEMRKGG